MKMSLALETTELLTGTGKSTQLTVLVDRVADPVDTGIVTDSLVCGVNKNDLEILVYRVLVYPVRVEYTETTALAANTFLSQVTQVTGGLQLGNTLVDGLTVYNTLVHLLLATTAANTHTVDYISLLSLKSQAASLIGSAGAGEPHLDAKDQGQEQAVRLARTGGGVHCQRQSQDTV